MPDSWAALLERAVPPVPERLRTPPLAAIRRRARRRGALAAATTAAAQYNNPYPARGGGYYPGQGSEEAAPAPEPEVQRTTPNNPPDFMPVEAGAQEEWMRVVYPTLDPARKAQADAYLQGTQAQGFTGTPQMGGPVPEGGLLLHRTARTTRAPCRGGRSTRKGTSRSHHLATCRWRATRPTSGSVQHQRSAWCRTGRTHPAMTEAMLRQQTPPYVYGGGYTPPRDVQREAAIARGDIPPPVTIGGKPNPEYQEYLDSIVAPRMAATARREQRSGTPRQSAADDEPAADPHQHA